MGAGASGTTQPPSRAIAVIGDFGSGKVDERRVADLVTRARPLAIVTTGDNVYDDRGYPALVGDFYGPWIASHNFFPAVGNHDYSEGIEAFDDYFTYLGGRRDYAVTRGGIRFLIIDSTAALQSPAALARRRDQVRRTLSTMSPLWQVVVLHHPPYSSGAEHGPSPEFRWPFGAWGADLVLAGHEHLYERLVEGGTTYVIDGLGGQDRYGFGPPQPGSQVRYAGDNGALFLTGTADRLSGEFWSAGGQLVDRFSVRR
jgi:predicted phosphodiesterase